MFEDAIYIDCLLDPWPTVTSQPIRLSTNFMTLIPSLTFTDYEWFPWIICNGCGMPAGNAYPSGHLVPSPILGLANAPIVVTKFLELAMSLLDFSHRIPLGTFSILHYIDTHGGGQYFIIITFLDFFINRLYRKFPGWYTVISARIHISPGTTLVKMPQNKWCLLAPTWRNSKNGAKSVTSQ